MSYGKEIGQILAEEVLELVITEELELLEIRDLDTLGTHITKTEQKLGKSHAKTKALKRLYKRKSGIEGIRNFTPPKEMDEAELQEIRGLERLRQEFNRNILKGDPEARQRAMRLQALQARKLRLGQMEEDETNEGEKKDKVSGLPTRGLEKSALMKSIIGTKFDEVNSKPVVKKKK